MYLEAFTSHFNSIADSRQSAKVTYPLHDVLFVTLCGVIAGAEGWSEIHDYAVGHHNWFKEKGILTEGVPVRGSTTYIFISITETSPAVFISPGVGWIFISWRTLTPGIDEAIQPS